MIWGLTPYGPKPVIHGWNGPSDGVWRFAFAFDTKRRAAILVGGDKSGVSEKHFYRQLVTKADERLTKHLASIKAEEGKKR